MNHTRRYLPALRLSLALTFSLLLTLQAHADYTVALVSDGLASRTLKPGDTFDLDVHLASDGTDRHDSSVLHLVFSSSGLVLNGYSWSAPYQTAGPDDASVPARSSLPTTITATTAAGTALPVDAADLWFSNLTTSSFAFSVGRVLRLSLSIPTQYVGPDTLTVRLAEATLARGIKILPTSTVPFVLRIEPITGPTLAALSVARSHTQVTLAWDATIGGAYVESTEDPTGDTWTRVNTAPTRDDNRFLLTPEAPTNRVQRFFRLRFP